MSSSGQRIEVNCPCCDAVLTVDPASGLVLNHQKKKANYSLEDALKREKTRKEKADELFQQAFDKEQKRTDQLEQKFQEALRSKDELEEPMRPFDLD